jgi:hypothetical protein
MNHTALVRDYFSRVSSLFQEAGMPLGEAWRSNMPWLSQELGQRIGEAPTGAPTGNPPAVKRPPEVQRRIITAALAWYEGFFAKRGRYDLKPEPFVYPTAEVIDLAVRLDNPIVALGRLLHYYRVTMFEDYCPRLAARAADHSKDRVVIAEIGTIHGMLSGHLRARYRNVTYVMIDIPESLCLTVYDLLAGNPELRFKLIASNAEIDSTDLTSHAYDYVCVPAPLATALRGRKMDLVWTFSAMGEFSNQYIALYYDLIQNGIRPDYFMFCNRFLNAVDAGSFAWRANENMASVLVDDRWDLQHWEIEPEAMACPYIDQALHPRYLEVALTRRSDKSDTEGAARCGMRDFLAAATIESWPAILADPSAYTMMYGSRPVLGYGDNIRRFWSSIRTTPGRDNILVFMHYLDYVSLGSGKLFEEWLFYAAVLLRLHQAEPDASSDDVKTWVAARVAEQARPTFRPLPGFGVGFVPPAEPLPPHVVRAAMYGVDVRAVLGIQHTAVG